MTSTILIADDDPFARQVLRSLLAEEGHRLLEASDGAEALELAQECLPDLLLLDVMMGEIDGYEVCIRLRAVPVLRELPILLITSLNDRESRLRGLNIGADGFISKPFDHAELLAQVRTIIRLNRYRRLLAEQERFQRLVALAPDGIAVVDAADSVLMVNPALEKLLGGIEGDQLLGRPVVEFLPSESVEQYLAVRRQLTDTTVDSVRTELLVRDRHGNKIPVELSIGRLDGPGDEALQLLFRDITARKQAEAQIQRQITQLTSLHAIGLAITASLNLSNTLTRLLDNLIEHLSIDAASVLLLNTRTGLLEPAAARGLSLPTGSHFLLRPDEGLAGIAFQTHRPVTVTPFTAQDVRCVRDRFLAARFSSYFALPLRARGETQGVLELMRRDRFAPDHHWWLYVESLAVQAAIAIHTATLFEQLQAANTELTYAYNATIEGWSRALDLRDHETEGHSVRVTEMTLQLARRLRVSPEQYDHLRRGALLHDIGKMGVPDRILLKPGPLSVEEWDVMRQHPTYAYEWLSPIPFLHQALDIPYAHHERWDGSGYPRGLKGDQIPLAARIFAVVDVWDALRSVRPYRSPWANERVLAHLRQLAGIHFDPAIVKAFIELITERDAK